MLKAVIFDMDGVIIDSEPMHAKAAVLALKKYGVEISADYCSEFIGSTTYYMCQRMVQEFELRTAPEELLRANNEMKELLLTEEGYPAVPYVLDLIKDLHSHGMQLIIASSSPARFIEYVMDSLKLRDYFNGYVSGEQLEHPKPAPDIFLAAAVQLGVAPDDCIVIEDSANGVNAAHAAGITCIGYVNPNSGIQDLRKAALLVEGFEEVDFDLIHQVFRGDHWQACDILTTDRLLIRELDVTDAEAFYDILADAETSKYYDDLPASPAEETERRRAYIRNVYKVYGYGQWGVFLKENRKLIGCCGIELRESQGTGDYELGYLIGRDNRRMGYAYEAAEAVLRYFTEKYHANRFAAVIDKRNIPSRQMAEKLGMRRSGEVLRNRRECYKYIKYINEDENNV